MESLYVIGIILAVVGAANWGLLDYSSSTLLQQ